MMQLSSLSWLIIPLLVGVSASIASGIIGSYVVVKRIVFISGSISHSVLGGIGCALWLKERYNLSWINPLYGTLIAAVGSAFLIGSIHLRYRQREDTVIAAIWSAGMAIGIVFLSFLPGYSAELSNFLFGNILWSSKSDLLILSLLSVVIVATVLLFHSKFQAICFDPEQAELREISVQKYYFFLLSLVAVSVVLLIETVGAMLVIAMLAIPPAVVNRSSLTLAHMMKRSILVGSFCTTSGLLCSYLLDWPSGATITLFTAAFYLISLCKRKR